MDVFANGISAQLNIFLRGSSFGTDAGLQVLGARWFIVWCLEGVGRQGEHFMEFNIGVYEASWFEFSPSYLTIFFII